MVSSDCVYRNARQKCNSLAQRCMDYHLPFQYNRGEFTSTLIVTATLTYHFYAFSEKPERVLISHGAV